MDAKRGPSEPRATAPARERATRGAEGSHSRSARAAEPARSPTSLTLGYQVFGVQALPSRHIWVYRNADADHEGLSVTVTNRVRTLKQLTQLISPKINLFGGPCRRLFDADLAEVKSLDDIVDGGHYLATSGEEPTADAHRSSACAAPPHADCAAPAGPPAPIFN